MPIIYLNKQAVCLETVHVNKPTSPKGSVWVGLKRALSPFQWCSHSFSSFPANQGSDNANMLARNKLCASKQKLSSQRQLRPISNPCIHPTKPSLSPTARQKPPNISFSLPEEEEIWSLSGRQVWCNRRLRNLGRLLLATPCQAHKEKNRTIRHGWESLIQSGAN